MNVISKLILCGLFMTTFSFAHAQNVHGVLRVVKGDVQIKSVKTGQVARARIGEQVYPKDVVITGKEGRVKIVMVDNNEINVSPESQVEIQQYDFDPNQGKKEVLLNVLYGKVRAKVEQKYDGKTSKFQVKTPAAVAGVRGTDFLTGYNKSDKSSSVVTFHGAVDFGTAGPGGSIQNAVSVTPGKTATSVAGSPPSPPVNVPKGQLEKMDNDTKADTAGAGNGKSDNDNKGKKDKDKDSDKKDGDKGKGDGDKGKADSDKKGDDGKRGDNGDKKGNAGNNGNGNGNGNGSANGNSSGSGSGSGTGALGATDSAGKTSGLGSGAASGATMPPPTRMPSSDMSIPAAPPIGGSMIGAGDILTSPGPVMAGGGVVNPGPTASLGGGGGGPGPVPLPPGGDCATCGAPPPPPLPPPPPPPPPTNIAQPCSLCTQLIQNGNTTLTITIKH